jgi:hypothetical protein
MGVYAFMNWEISFQMKGRAEASPMAAMRMARAMLPGVIVTGKFSA